MTVTIDTKAEKTIITCNVCKKNTIKVDGLRSKRAGYTKAIELGWRWKEKDVQICTSCRKTAAEKAEGKKASTPATKSSKKDEPRPKVTLFGRKNVKTASKPNSAPVFNAGQSIGKIARSAKKPTAPAAE